MPQIAVQKSSYIVVDNGNPVDINHRELLGVLQSWREQDRSIDWYFNQNGTSNQCFERDTREYSVITQLVQKGDSIHIHYLFKEFEDYFDDLINILPDKLTRLTINLSQLEEDTFDLLRYLTEKTQAHITYNLHGEICEFDNE